MPPINLLHYTILTLASTVAGISSLLICLNQCQTSYVPDTPTRAIEPGPVQSWVAAAMRDFFRVESERQPHVRGLYTAPAYVNSIAVETLSRAAIDALLADTYKVLIFAIPSKRFAVKLGERENILSARNG